MRTLLEPTCQLTLYIAGDLVTAKAALREECMEKGLCVTVTPTTFIYTAGAEDGVAVGFVNYPRFPTTPADLWKRAEKVARMLMAKLCQHTALVVGPDQTLWITARPEDNR